MSYQVHIVFFYDLTFILRGGEDGGGVTGKKAVRDCLTFVSVTPAFKKKKKKCFNETSRHRLM